MRPWTGSLLSSDTLRRKETCRGLLPYVREQQVPGRYKEVWEQETLWSLRLARPHRLGSSRRKRVGLPSRQAQYGNFMLQAHAKSTRMMLPWREGPQETLDSFTGRGKKINLLMTFIIIHSFSLSLSFLSLSLFLPLSLI